MEKPSIGKIVQYTERRGQGPTRNCLAIVTGVNTDGTVSLNVSCGSFPLAHAAYDANGARGTWHWRAIT